MTLIDDAYVQLEEMDIEFNRTELEGFLFEKVLKEFKVEKKDLSESKLRGRSYAILSSYVMSLERHDFKDNCNYFIDYASNGTQIILRQRGRGGF